MGWAKHGQRHSCNLQRRPDPALDGPEMRQTFIMGLALRSVVPLEMLGVRLPEEDWIGELSPNHGASKTPPLRCAAALKPPALRLRASATRQIVATPRHLARCVTTVVQLLQNVCSHALVTSTCAVTPMTAWCRDCDPLR